MTGRLWLSEQASKDLKRKSKLETKPEFKLIERNEEHSRDRARRKAMFQAAKTTDKMLTEACDSYDVAAKEHISHKKVLKGLSEDTDRLEDEAKVLDDKIKQLQNKWRLKRKAYGDAKSTLNDFSIKLTAAARGIANVRAAWDAFQVAWGKLSKTQEKRLTAMQLKYHRAARKRAKEILRDR